MKELTTSDVTLADLDREARKHNMSRLDTYRMLVLWPWMDLKGFPIRYETRRES